MKHRKRFRCDHCRQKTGRSDTHGWGFLCHTCKKQWKSKGTRRLAVFGIWITKCRTAKLSTATDEAIFVARNAQ